MSVLRIGTRGSALARAQSSLVAERLAEKLGAEVELVEIVTGGDTSRAPLPEIGGQGVFVAALREALADGRVDAAVHSLKDLPTQADDRLLLAAVPAREDPRDALVASSGRTLADLTRGARIGTGSPRRAAQLRALGIGLEVVPARGNVDTRLRHVREGRFDAVVLARAGLVRLGRAHEATEILEPDQMLPAPGQGALAVEVAASAAALADDVRAVLDDADTRAAVGAERCLLRTLEAGCMAPVGALAEVARGESGAELRIRAVVCAPDGSRAVRLSGTGRADDAERVGTRLAQALFDEGAAALVEEAS